MANPAPTINQINAFNATQGTTIDFNIIGGTELVRSNKIYIYDLSDNSLICTHLYVSTESIHELPPNTDGSIVYESGKSSADFVNGAQYYAQIQTFTDIAGTEGGSGLSVSKLFWCLVDPSLTIATIPSSISTTSYNVSATYDANTSVVSNIIQQYQFSLYSATGSLLQSSGVVVGNGEQQGTSTAYDISYNFSGLSVGSSYYVVVDVTTTQGMSISAQSGTFTVSIDTPTLGEATVVNNACDGYISVTSNLSGEYGGSGSGDIVSFETDSKNVFTKLQVALEPIQEGTGDPSPTNVRPITGHDSVEVMIEGKNLFGLHNGTFTIGTTRELTVLDGTFLYKVNTSATSAFFLPPATLENAIINKTLKAETYTFNLETNALSDSRVSQLVLNLSDGTTVSNGDSFTLSNDADIVSITTPSAWEYNVGTYTLTIQLELGSTATEYEPYTEQTISQSFNVTLTPTVIDETPYLFKKTGDVRGDRESLELVGGTVNWNQLVQNGDFANTSKWVVSNLSLSVSGNVGTVTSTSVGSQVLQQTNNGGDFVDGHKYFTAMLLKANTSGHTFGASLSGLSLNINTLVPLTEMPTVWTAFHGIVNFTLQSSGNNTFRIAVTSSTALSVGDYFNVRDVILIDLTAFFGNSSTADYVYSLEQATAGAGIAWLRKYFPDLFAYSPYNTGTLESVKPTAHVTVGVNQWDEVAELGYINELTGEKSGSAIRLCSKNYIPIIPNTEYYFQHSGVAKLFWYDFDKNFIGSPANWGQSASFTSPNNCHYAMIGFPEAYSTTYKNDYCLNISNPAINGKYFPADHHTYPISELELRGILKLVDGELRFDGDTRKADGSTQRKYGIVDLGSLHYGYNASYGFYASTSQIAENNRPKDNGTNGIPNAICVGYGMVSAGVMTGGTTDMCIAIGAYIYVSNSNYTDPTALKTALSGKYLVYEKATPTTETADPFTDPQEVSIYGTEEFVSSNGVPVGNKTTYKTRDIFEGTIDLASGVLTVHRKGSLFVGDEDWQLHTYNSSITSYKLRLSDMKAISATDDIFDCDKFEYRKYAWAYTDYGLMGGSDRTVYFTYPNSEVSTIELWKSWLAKNTVQLIYDLAEPLTFQLTPHEIETLVGTNNVWSEQGEIELSYHIPITNLLVKRQDIDDVSGNWLTLYSQSVEQASDMDFTFIDFLNQYGKTYKYALVPLLTQQQSGVEVEVEGGYTVSGAVQSVFDGVYIGDSTGIQRLKAGVAYNNLNTNQQVGVIPTLGNKYPVIVSNGNIQYDTGSVSGLIVPDDFYSDGNLSRLDMSNKREVISSFITNKKPKVLKDWNGNIWLVVFTDNVDVSFDNNYGMGVATLSSGWTEVGDPTNQEDLQRTGLVNVGGD